MREKMKASGDFASASIRDLGPEFRNDPGARKKLASQKRVQQAEYVLERANLAMAQAQANVDAARAELEAARAEATV